MRRVLSVVGVVAVVVLGLAGCDKSSYRCVNGACEVSVGGTPEVSFESGGPAGSSRGVGDDDAEPESTFEVLGYAEGSVEVQSMGDVKTIQVGQSARVGQMTIQVVSVKGESAELKVRQ